MLSFQHVINVKIINELFYILFQNLVCIWCLWHRSVQTGHVSRAGEQHADTGQLVGQRGRAPVPSSQRDLSGDRRAFPRGCPNADVMTEPAGTLPAPAEMPRPFGWLTPPHSAGRMSHRGPGVRHTAALQLQNARWHRDKRTSADGSAHAEEPGTRGSALTGAEAASSHRDVHFSTSPHFHRNNRWDRTPRETPRGPQISLVAEIGRVLARWARAWVLTELGLGWWTWAKPSAGCYEALTMQKIT